MLDGVEENKYRRVRLLGQGGMGAVYKAVHALTGRRVALKIITGDVGMHSLERLKRFHREARAAGALDSQHIVQVLDAGTEVGTGTPYLAMEYLQGHDLQQELDRVGVLPPLIALRIVAQACVGLQKPTLRGSCTGISSPQTSSWRETRRGDHRQDPRFWPRQDQSRAAAAR